MKSDTVKEESAGDVKVESEIKSEGKTEGGEKESKPEEGTTKKESTEDEVVLVKDEDKVIIYMLNQFFFFIYIYISQKFIKMMNSKRFDVLWKNSLSSLLISKPFFF